jgi:hypothetical protein
MGGAVYEHIAVVPRWKLAPPASLAMFQGEYGLNAGQFWMLIHPVTVIFLFAALVANWKTTRKRYIAITISGYLIILVTTFIWFVPELLSITTTPYQPVIDKNLVKRANLWEILSLIRLLFLFHLAAILLFSLTKGNTKSTPVNLK